MKHKLHFGRIIVTLLLFAVSTLSWAYDFEVDGIYYNFNADGTSVSVTNGNTSYSVVGYSGTIEIPSSVTYNDKNYEVTAIGPSAFGTVKFAPLISVTIPESVTVIGDNAFEGCTDFTSMIIPDNVTTVGACAFAGCSGLKTLTIGESVSTIGNLAFTGCTNLSTVSLNSNDLVSNSSPNHSFIDIFGSQVKKFIIGDGVTTIGNHAFYRGINLESVALPNSLVKIGSYAFSECYGLTSVTIPDGVETIDKYAFNGCSSLISVALPNGIETIDDYTFYCCTSLVSVTISESVSSIGDFAFSGCSAMTSIEIPNSVTSIGIHCFSNSANLESILIGSGLKDVGEYAFAGCGSLSSFTCTAESVPTTGNSVFSESPQSSSTLYVPASSVDAYKTAAQWKNFGTILPIADEPIYIETDVTDKFPTDWSGWNGATGYTDTKFAPKVTTNDGRNVQVCERFNGSSATTGTVFYRTLTGLTNGIYRIELYGAASSTKGRDTGIDSDMTADDEGDETAVYLYATTPSGTVSQYIPVHWATSFSEVATAVLNDVEVTDGTIEIGMYSEKKYTNWHVVQIKGVTAIVDAEERHADVLQTAQWLLAAENYVCVIGEERTALAQTVSQYGTVSEHTAEAYKTAIDAIVAASITFDDARPSYEVWADIVSRSYPYALAEKKAAAENAAAQLPSSAADAESKREVIIPLYRTYAESSTMLEGVDGSEDVTDLYIENPKAETGYSETGWRVTWGGGSPVGSISIKTAEPWTDASGSSDHRYFDGGYWGAQSWDATQQQEVTLPAGRYQLSVMGRSSMDVEQTLFAGENFIDMFHIGASGGLFNRGWELSYLEFELSETTTLNIGVRGVTNYRYNWMSFSDFRLVKFPGETAVESLKAKPETTDSANPIYDLMGRRLKEKPAKGYYIQGGKKYFVK